MNLRMSTSALEPPLKTRSIRGDRSFELRVVWLNPALRKASILIRRILLAIGVLTVLILTTPLVTWWAMAYAGPIEQPKGEVLILLSAANDDNGGISYSSYWRARQALVAWQTGSFRKIIILGGEGPGICNFLDTNGIPRDAMIADSMVRTTHQSAVDSAKYLKGIPGKKVLLTSDFHMYRALHVFRRQGISVAPMAVPDVLHLTEHWNGRFTAFETMLVESVKIVYYWSRGWM
jgi:uncharacterized SAM-binding protein YcdF (DUF218 family)